MPGLRGIDNIKKAMERRQRERDESLRLALEAERDEAVGTPQVAEEGARDDIERRIAEEVGSGIVEQVIILGPVAPSWKKGPYVVRGRGPRADYG